MTPEDLAAAGLSQSAMATDDELAELVDEIEAILLQAQGTPGDLEEQLTRARLDGFVYGYRLGARPTDTQATQDL
ncbi:hypothetical protein KVA01_14960 [Kocuria varians]|uniref:Uncharacterized protein n=2 Tax=Kocuria varians TaxID=1272 RepID=A0A4Y4D2E4_KOCVA|nr:hypothetical protein KVA01_14960 [Kocuria varians]